MSRQGSVTYAHNATNSATKDKVEVEGGPLHFPVDDELKPTETMKDTILGAKAATESEHRMTLWQGLRLYPKACMWSVIISTCIAMEGYDVCLINNFYAFPQFDKKVSTLSGPIRRHLC